MIIVKLTVLSFLITTVYLFAMKVWAESDIAKYLTARAAGKYPKWIYPIVLFILIDIIGIFASAIYLLFFR